MSGVEVTRGGGGGGLVIGSSGLKSKTRDGIKRGEEKWCSIQGRRRWWHIYPSIRIIIMHSRQCVSVWLFCSCLCMHIVDECMCAQLPLSHYSMLPDHFWMLMTGVDFSWEWMKGLSYDSVHMQVPLLVPQMERLWLFIIISNPPIAPN